MDGTAPAPTPGTPAPLGDAAPSRLSQLVLAGLVGVVLLGLVYRGYGHRIGDRPTDHEPAAVRYAIDLNRADKAELMQVPGVGPNLADAILSHRDARGGFASVDELTGVPGVGGGTFAKVRPWVRIEDPGSPPPTETVPELVKLERKPVPPTPVPQWAERPAKLQPGDPPIDVNTADEADLLKLPGVGPTISKRIIEARGLARFEQPEDLRRVSGIGKKTMDKIRPYVVCR